MASVTLIWLSLFIYATLAQISDVTFTLPWGTWQATSYDADFDYYVFSDVRFAKPPTGDRRFARPELPDRIDNPEDIKTGPPNAACYQVDPKLPCNPGGNLPIGYEPAPSYELEDCLFFDLYVPKAVYDAAKKDEVEDTPVVIWIYGGAYVFGKKNDFTNATPFYNGSASIGTAIKNGGDLIYVAGNYRLGALGWLAGETMEADAQPNAGLYDQRLLIEVIQYSISQVGGNRSDISVWGESAGGGSILHHLVADWEDYGPGFNKALLESPAYQWAWDRDSGLEKTFQNFSKIAGCSDGDQMECLREVDSDKIYNSNQQLFQSYTACTGLFNVGPAVDGELIKKLPPVSFMKGEFYSIDSMIVSHVDNEAKNFVPPWVQTPEQFEEFVDLFFDDASLEPIREQVEKQYPAEGPPYLGDQQARLRALIQDAVFTCNTRQLYNAYKNTSTKVYMEQFSIDQTLVAGGAFHALDVMPTFWNSEWDLSSFLLSQKIPGIDTKFKADFAAGIIGKFSPLYQSYYVSHALTGTPNAFTSAQKLPTWNEASDNGNYVTSVMNAGILKLAIIPTIADFFNADFTDTINTEEACGFWDRMAVLIDDIEQKGTRKSNRKPYKDVPIFKHSGDLFHTHDQIPIPGEL